MGEDCEYKSNESFFCYPFCPPALHTTQLFKKGKHLFHQLSTPQHEDNISTKQTISNFISTNTPFSTMYALTLLCALALPAVITASQVGDSGTLSSLDGGLGGVATVTSKSTIEISQYKLADASAPALYWWGSTSDDLSSGFRISNTHITQAATSDSLTINLDAGHSPSDFNVVGLWCEKFKTNFGQTVLKASSSGTSGDSQSTITGTAPSRTSTSGASMNTFNLLFAIGVGAAGFMNSALFV